MQNVKWKGKSYGGYFGNWCFAMLLKAGLLPAYLLLMFVAFYFAYFRPSVNAISRNYLKMVFGKKPMYFSPKVYLHFLNFGICLLDKAAYHLKSKKIKIVNLCGKEISGFIKEGGSCIVLTAHFGGWAISANTLKQYNRPVKILGTQTEDGKIASLWEKSSKIDALKSVGGYEDEFASLAAYKELKNGTIIAIHSDRYAGGKYIETPFLGKKIKFSIAPFALAMAARKGIIQTLCVRKGLCQYQMVELCHAQSLKTHADINEFAQKCVSELESYVKKYPYQWFNFYDYWE